MTIATLTGSLLLTGALLCGQSASVLSVGDSGVVFSPPRGWNVISESRNGIILGNFKAEERVKALIAPWGKAALWIDRMPDDVESMQQWVASFERGGTSNRREQQVASLDGTAIKVLSFHWRLEYSAVTVTHYFFDRCRRPLSFALWLRDGVSARDAEALRSLSLETIRTVRCKR